MPRRQPAPPPRDPLDNAPDLANAQRAALDRIRRTAAQHARADYTRSPTERRASASRRRKPRSGLSQRNYDLPDALAQIVADIAAEAGCPMSGVVAFLLLRGLQTATLEDLRDALAATRSPRFEFVLADLSPETVEDARTAFFGPRAARAT